MILQKIIKIKEIKKDELSDFINKTVIDEKPKEKKKFIFQLSDEQQEKYRKWARTHDCVIRNKDGKEYVCTNQIETDEDIKRALAVVTNFVNKVIKNGN